MYQSISLYAIFGWLGLLALALGLNELCRRSKGFSLLMFLIIPAALSVTWWPHSAGPGTTMNTWFYWVKTYSVMAGCLGFMAIRFIPRLSKNKVALFFPAFILALNIGEAVLRDFQVYGMHLSGQLVEGMATRSGPWNIMNGIAGILNILTISGWLGIFITKDKKHDMIWPDMLWFWVIAYDLWNLAYGYNCVGDQSFYSGFCILAAATIPELTWRKGAYLQHRAQTLAYWMILCMSFSYIFDHTKFAVKASLNPIALFTLSFPALAWNIAVFVYHYAKVFKHKRNIARVVHCDVREYKELIAERDETAEAEPGLFSRTVPKVAIGVMLLAVGAMSARAQAPGAGMSANELAKEISNPVTSLWQLQFQCNNLRLETGNNFPTDGKWANNCLFQPVMPISLTDKLNLITRPVITLYDSVPVPVVKFNRNQPFPTVTSERTTAFGDMVLAQVLSPAGTEPWIYGVGPTWIFPTAGSDAIGQGKWQVGPAVGAGYITKEFMVAAFAQQWWSFAGENDRKHTNQISILPLIYRFFGDGWSVGYNGTITADWTASSGERWTVPVGASIGKVVKLGILPVQVQLGGQYFVERAKGGPEWNIQLQVTPVIPKLVRGTLFASSSRSSTSSQLEVAGYGK